MNTKHIHDLTLRLCQALDQNYDVVNMDAVMSVISTLEGTTITKEQLETTRLAKFINHLRRRTKDEHLARRAKSLLKKWREMVGILQQQQQFIDATSITSSATLPSVSGHSNISYQPQRLRSQSISPAASSMHIDVTQHQSNSNSIPVVAVSSAITEHIPRVTNVISASYNNNKRLANIESQNERTPDASIHVKKQPTSFENVLVGFGVTDRSNVDISSNNSAFRNKLKKQQIVISPDTETFIIDHSSNSNSEMSLMLPLTNRSANLGPIIIDIQDSNSGSNLVTPISTNIPITTKIQIPGQAKAESVSLDNILNTASATSLSPLKQKKERKEKRRKEKGEYDIQREIDAFGDSKAATVLLEETSNKQHHGQCGESDEKYSSFANEEKSRLAYPEILSLLDNSSMSSMFPPENSTHPIDEQNKVNCSASKSSRTSFNLSTSDLTFAGKFKPCSALLPTTSSTDTVLHNTLRRTVSPKITHVNNFSLHSGRTTSKFAPFRDIGFNSNDSNSYSQASQTDLINVVSNDKMMPAHQTHDNLNLQNRAVPAINVPTPQLVTTSNVPPSKSQFSNNFEVASNAPVSPEKKVPRKRGRKKGSKGVDSVIAKESSLSSQMLKSSLGMGSKKVKTTKELYTEMQNRKLGITTSSPSPSSTGWQISQQQTSRPTSSCSEPSLQSPHTFDACSTNATMSTMATRSTPENMTNIHAGECETTSDTGTSEPSGDSSAVPKHLKRSLSFDSNSNIQQQPEEKINTNPLIESNKYSDTGNQIVVIEKQLIEILKKLPPASLSNAIELKCTAELVPCTCKVIEISQTNNDSDESAKNKVKEGEPTKQNEQTPNYHESFLSGDVDKFAIKIEANAGNTSKSDEIVLKPISPNSPLPPTVSKPKPKKSIFDLDFDEDEDPLPKIKAEAAAACLKKERESIVEAEPEPETIETTASDFQQSQLVNFKASVVEHTQLNDEIPMPILSTYEVVEDPKCVAMQRFDLQTQRITKFHIDALHNCFIPNVNGNWDDANYTFALNMALNDVTTAVDVEHRYVVTDGSNVVPKYGVLATERIPKDLSHLHFFETSRPKKAAATPKMFTIPFLGVARSVLLNKFKLKSDKCKTCHKANGTESTKRASRNDGSAVEQFEANNRIEEYKTDEQRICISIKTENNQTASGNYNLTYDAKLNESKGLTDICDQLNDAVLSLTKSFDVAAGAMVSKNNNNNVMLKDITIDVVSHGTDPFLADSNESNGSDRNGQNLLAIADHLDYSSNIGTKTPLNVYSNVEVSKELRECNEIDSTVVTISDSSCKSEGSLFPNAMLPMDTTEKAKNATFSVNNDKNAYIRQSSSCSNSTLKQTQPSISFKWKRQFKDQTILDVNTERRSKRRKVIPRSVADNVHVGSASQKNKRPRIKRIKIAINGKVATQMQFSGGSSNNSSDENNEKPPIEGNGDGNEGTPIEDRNKSVHKVTAENEEFVSINSPGSHISTYNQCNLESGDDEIIANSVENNYNDEQEMEYDCYEEIDVDGDVEFDEYEDIDDYSGDFHEVVTRDISAPSTGNNHIVLTIKKTPSKTNSSSNSLSAISPTIASSNTYGSHASAITISPIISNTTFVQTKNDNKGLDMHALIVKELEVCEDINNQLTSEVLETTNLPSIEEIRPQLQSDVQIDTHPTITTSIIQQCGGIKRFEDPENSPSAPITKSICVKKRKQHRRRKIKKNTKEHLDCLRDVKLHRELFFSHEVIISDAAGIKQSILNFSSCSSSCANDSDYDHCNDLEGNISFDADVKSSGTANSEIDIQLESLKRESYEHQRKCSLSASPFTIYSSCSSCDLSTENRVISEVCGVNGSDNVSGDALDLKNNSGIKGGNIDGVKIVDEEHGADNDESMLSVNTAISKAKSNPALADSTGSNIEDNVNEELPLENNGLLYSFNNIYYDGRATVDAEKQEQMLANKNCDDYNNIYNKNSNNINFISNYIKDPCLKTQINLSKQTGNGNEFKEQNYINIHGDSNVNTDAALNINTKQQFVDGVSNVGCTGLRVVDEDTDQEDGNNCARIQQFKEWHQVLQLRSYNDELLTVLPYVVLD
ncbi:mediator of RNA polymerase II transcription subunit 26 isoform X1 [Bactrocera neohumeralis]|uniref:mediator of RNA polymerase II transcription subunit 26 isoform X1 n=1 Tax=Bactrocera neohumeralis TaxID=98809 RepID=UPI0021665A43|nr:mediator of RNA polymerase II transcription subunit 26 isoform X1 [Bactrocera neohumeralis]XP_050339796.1 mediator of RNA polymerase II transcription subunit 26 isoform X1 [Bactrocera neohumeralis]XP_050339797.1 mediator of RNA polymerase II transcription subunit 26 isoform X1 [Bactrocera neohumeralis]